MIAPFHLICCNTEEKKKNIYRPYFLWLALFHSFHCTARAPGYNLETKVLCLDTLQ